MTTKLLKSSLATTGWLLTLALPTLPAQAASFVNQRDALNANDQIDWASLDFGVSDLIAPDTIAKFLPYSFTGESQKKLGYSVDIPNLNNPRFTSPFVFPVTTSVPANFSLGDAVLLTGLIPGRFPAEGNPGPITIKFNQPVLAVGTQLAVDDQLEEAIAFIQAFDAQDNLLNTFSKPAKSSLEIDNSAAFLGVESEVANISKIVISSSIKNRALGINFVSLRYATIPEPATILGLGLFAMSLLTVKPHIASKH
ncbi:hypothetical protein [Nostoc sp. CMAA1605]|uniref:hypothetical protein n=1 Tax=Nostoc sp. CMAA1605 TaxID=2055159 RepID=UPI001F385DC3|nr:hypothetical protein [Nostoc sp. CMAA1605]MCF4966456.1 hypothetical protein [Nostoc sp. CMAA1605]